ncbi:DUF4129 domain-containing protein [Microbulbifer sp. SAOS-129_SWC]|uniref:DUF4129 domain-containing protein n=1 Tax=Microbulbifer sp. SAOS-129_SWC TaxID=3145235 RepID=UPI0032165B3F
MDLNRLAVRARLRSPWESIDLGIALARGQWWTLCAVWLLPAALLFTAGALVFPDSPTLVFLLVWWLKPVYDRLPLFIASRALFGESVSAGSALRQFFAQNRRDWFAWLTWRRLSPTRSFDLPVTLLEQSSGATRSARIGVLHRKHTGAATWLTIAGTHLEFFLMLALLALIYLFVPEQLHIQWLPFLSSGANWLEWALNGLYLLVMAAVAPFYVVAGFCLYIGRRIELEAWDIEIQFRTLRQRQRQQRNEHRRAGAAAQLLLLCALGIATAVPAPASRADTPQQARESIDKVLAGDDFHRRETEHGWRLKETQENNEAFPEWLIRLIEWLEQRSADKDDASDDTPSGFGPLIGGLIEVLLWGGGAALVIYLLWQYREPLRNALRLRPRRRAPPVTTPETLFGLDVRRDSLPDDVCAEVLRLWAAGDQRTSLGLLYRATLAHLIERYQFEFGDHLTERECAGLVKRRHRDTGESARPNASAEPDKASRLVSAALSHFVQRLTGTWQQLAYAHRAPAPAQLQQLCEQWREVFADES